jgi:hypothetical protein
MVLLLVAAGMPPLLLLLVVVRSTHGLRPACTQLASAAQKRPEQGSRSLSDLGRDSADGGMAVVPWQGQYAASIQRCELPCTWTGC